MTSKYIKSIATGKVYKLTGYDDTHYDAIDIDNKPSEIQEDGTYVDNRGYYRFPKRLFVEVDKSK